jgi:hypothetical protein
MGRLSSHQRHRSKSIKLILPFSRLFPTCLSGPSLILPHQLSCAPSGKKASHRMHSRLATRAFRIPTASFTYKPTSYRATMTTASSTANGNGAAHPSAFAPPPTAPDASKAGKFTLPDPVSSQDKSKPSSTPGTYRNVEKHDNAAMRVRVGRDFRSDTLTIPTDEMFEVMRHASRGDDVYEVRVCF